MFVYTASEDLMSGYWPNLYYIDTKFYTWIIFGRREWIDIVQTCTTGTSFYICLIFGGQKFKIMFI